MKSAQKSLCPTNNPFHWKYYEGEIILSKLLSLVLLKKSTSENMLGPFLGKTFMDGRCPIAIQWSAEMLWVERRHLRNLTLKIELAQIVIVHPALVFGTKY